MTYIDTSALAKWYLSEPRSEDFSTWIQAVSATYISTLTVVEMRCLPARRRRNQELPVELENKVFATLQDDIANGFLIQQPIEDPDVQGALRILTLLPDHPLRTLDALHLAIARKLGIACVVATADRVMALAAQTIGFDVVRFD